MTPEENRRRINLERAKEIGQGKRGWKRGRYAALRAKVERKKK